MKLVIQRVSSASVSCFSHFDPIGKGLCVMFGAETGDCAENARLLAKKTANLRIFEDAERKMNLSVLDIGGEVLAVPNFTLAADTKKGNRPSFIASGDPKVAEKLFEEYKAALKQHGLHVATGIFGADMAVDIQNDGPITIIMDTKEWAR